MVATQEKTLSNQEIVIIGSGNVAFHLSQALRHAGHLILQVYSRNVHTAQQLADVLGSKATDTLEDVETCADAYLVCVPDDAVEPIVAKLVSRVHKSGIICHTCGSVGLSTLIHHPHDIGVFYPLQTFTRHRQLDVRKIPFLIEGSNTQVSHYLKDLARTIADNVYFITSEERKHLHVAAVSSCNFVNHLLSEAYAYVDKQGLDPHLLDPLMRETLSKFMDGYPNDTQTGPAKRGDDRTITKHLNLLQKEDSMQELYKLFTKHIVNKYHESNL